MRVNREGTLHIVFYCIVCNSNDFGRVAQDVVQPRIWLSSYIRTLGQILLVSPMQVH